MGHTKANGVGSPGTKNPVADYDATKSNESEALQAAESLEPPHGDNLQPSLGNQRVLDSLNVISRNILQKVRCSSNVDIYRIPDVFEYSHIYGVQPRFIVSTSEGFTATDPNGTGDPYTSKSGEIMKARCEKVNNSIDHGVAH